MHTPPTSLTLKCELDLELEQDNMHYAYCRIEANISAKFEENPLKWHYAPLRVIICFGS